MAAVPLRRGRPRRSCDQARTRACVSRPRSPAGSAATRGSALPASCQRPARKRGRPLRTLCPLARKRGNVAQVVGEELALAVVIGGVSEERLSSRALLYACVAHLYAPVGPPRCDGSERKHMPLAGRVGGGSGGRHMSRRRRKCDVVTSLVAAKRHARRGAARERRTRRGTGQLRTAG